MAFTFFAVTCLSLGEIVALCPKNDVKNAYARANASAMPKENTVCGCYIN